MSASNTFSASRSEVSAFLIRPRLDEMCADASDRGLIVQYAPTSEPDLSMVDPGEFYAETPEAWVP